MPSRPTSISSNRGGRTPPGDVSLDGSGFGAGGFPEGDRRSFTSGGDSFTLAVLQRDEADVADNRARQPERLARATPATGIEREERAGGLLQISNRNSRQ